MINIDNDIDIDMEIQFGERVGHKGWLIRPKLFRPKAYPTCLSSIKLCKFISKFTSSWFLLLTAGVVTSPNYPDNYPNNLDQTQTLQVQRGKMLRLEFTHFAVYWGSTCQYDYVKITDGDGTTLMDNSCGYSDPSHSPYFRPPTITTRSNTVEIFFHTNIDHTSVGWSLSWSAVTPGLKDLIQTASKSFIHLISEMSLT